MKTIKDYHNSYLKCDILLLANVLWKFSCLKTYDLYLTHYLSGPSLSWDAMRNMTKVEHELISDADIYLFFEKCMRDRFSYISKRYSKANNKYLKYYYLKQELKHIIYLKDKIDIKIKCSLNITRPFLIFLIFLLEMSKSCYLTFFFLSFFFYLFSFFFFFFFIFNKEKYVLHYQKS